MLIEPLHEARPFLQSISRQFPYVDYIVAAAAGKPGNVVLNVHPEMARTSEYWESDYAPGSVAPREVPAVTLDQVTHDRDLAPPLLVKIDVQGAELEVLAGAEHTLEKTECVVMETSLLEFFRGAPLAAEVVDYMNRHGFVIYDVWALQYRPHDGALTMLDIAFVKANGAFRSLHRSRPT